MINRHLNLKNIAKLVTCTTFHIFFLQIEFIIIVNKMAFNKWSFVLDVFETILGLDSSNSSSKINSKSCLNVGDPENQRNLQTRNFWTIPKTLNSHKVRLN